MPKPIKTITALDLRAGDVLAPDDSRVLRIGRERGGVMVKLKVPGNRAAWYWLPPTWLLDKIEVEP